MLIQGCHKYESLFFLVERSNFINERFSLHIYLLTQIFKKIL
jgi:hypothetical protein